MDRKGDGIQYLLPNPTTSLSHLSIYTHFRLINYTFGMNYLMLRVLLVLFIRNATVVEHAFLICLCRRSAIVFFFIKKRDAATKKSIFNCYVLDIFIKLKCFDRLEMFPHCFYSNLVLIQN